MGQVIIVENSPADFDEKLSAMLAGGFHVVPGTTYVSHVEHMRVLDKTPVESIPYFFVVLTSAVNQMVISALKSESFHTAVNEQLKVGYKVVPGTIYATTIKTAHDKKVIEPIFTVTIERD